MDPKANLAEQLKLASRITWNTDFGLFTKPEDVARLAELVIALDEWQRKGGFSPYTK